MALTIFVDGVNWIGSLLRGSLRVTTTSGSRKGRATFSLLNHTPLLSTVRGDHEPAVPVVIADGATTFFSGDGVSYRVVEWTPGQYRSEVTAMDAGATPAVTMAPFSLSDRDAATTYGLLVDTGSPLCEWHLNESSGTTATDANGYRDGTYVDTPTLGATGPFYWGDNRGITLNGSSQYVDMGGALLRGMADFTISAWFKTTYAGANQTIYAERSAAGNPYIVLVILPNGRPAFYYRDDAATADVLTAPSGDWSDGYWHHVGLSKLGTYLWLIVDGQVVATSNLTASDTLTGTCDTWVGADPGSGGGAYFNGSLDEVIVCDSPLLESQLQAMYGMRDVHRYKAMTIEYVWDGAVGNLTATATTLDVGLQAGQYITLTSANCRDMRGILFLIREMDVTWLNATTPEFVITCGDVPLHLAAAFP